MLDYPGMRKFAGFALIALLAACQSRDSKVVAKVGKLSITETEFRRKLSEVAPEYQNYVMTPNGRRQFLDVLIREKMILAAAGDSDVRTSQPFKAEMDKLKAELAERLAGGREQLLTQLWLDDLRKKGILGVSDEEVRQYHEQNPYEVDVRHILLATAEEAEAILKKIKGGQNFAAMAQTKSLDADTAVNGGRMPPVIYGEVIPELEDVTFKARVGETVGPIKSKFGYHLVRKETQRPTSFSKIEERIRKVLEKQKLDRHLQSLQSRYPVEVMDVQLN